MTSSDKYYERICRNCLHYHHSSGRGFIEEGLCTEITDWKGDYKVVSATASCNLFTQGIVHHSAKEAGYTGGGCFITTACVNYYGCSDDCYELTTLRNFRDSYLASTEEGSAMIQEYYSIAPSIVDKLNSSSNKKEHYEYIYKEIQECVRAIENKEYTHTVNTYKKMVSHLQETL